MDASWILGLAALITAIGGVVYNAAQNRRQVKADEFARWRDTVERQDKRIAELEAENKVLKRRVTELEAENRVLRWQLAGGPGTGATLDEDRIPASP